MQKKRFVGSGVGERVRDGERWGKLRHGRGVVFDSVHARQLMSSLFVKAVWLFRISNPDNAKHRYRERKKRSIWLRLLGAESCRTRFVVGKMMLESERQWEG